MKKGTIIGIFIVVLLVITVGLFKACSNKEAKVTVETTKVRKGAISTEVTATGTIEAVKTVEVGTQVSGKINKIYVDFNSHVKAGQLLAELDRKPLLTALDVAGASLDNAKAELTYQTANYNRMKTLNDKKLVAESDYDLALYNYEQAKTALKSAQSNYDKAKINLDYAYIYSPIDGIVLNRAVDEGQTVAASFNTPTLFTIANDLTQMQVEASVDEADIGQVKLNQRVEFNVDAYPDDNFDGVVTQIRFQPVVTSNVVTYTVIVQASNPDKKLMPGMTANITIIVAEAKDACLIPSKVLRFKPDSTLLAEYFRSVNEKPDTSRSSKRGQYYPGKKFNGSHVMNNQESNRSIVWIKSGNDIHPVHIVTGINNEIDVQVVSGLKEGEDVVTAINTPASENNPSGLAQSPFMPRRPSSNRKRN